MVDALDDFSNDQADEKKKYADRINKKRFDNLDDAALSKKFLLWRKGSVSGALIRLRDDICPDVLAICSGAVDKQVRKGNGATYNLYCQDDEVVAANWVLDWIKKCGEIRGEVKLLTEKKKRVDDGETTQQSPQEEDRSTHAPPEIDADYPFDLPLKILTMAGRLRVPHDSLGKFLTQYYINKLRGYIIPLELVREIYDPMNSECEETERAAKDIAYNCIFDAWYNRQFKNEEDGREETNPQKVDYLLELKELRDGIKGLDEDLHRASIEKGEFLARRSERRHAERVERNGTAVHDAGDRNGSQDNGVATPGEIVGGGDAGQVLKNGDVSGDSWSDQVNDAAQL